jgi:hypothetical protein
VVLLHRKLSAEKLKVRNHVGDLDVDGRIILKYILKEEGVTVWTRFI